MGYLVDGQWRSDRDFPTNEGGEFVRWESEFRQWVTADGSSGFAPESGRYHLYAAHACPWAHRVMMTRALLGLEDFISVSLAHPLMLEEGWDLREGHAPVPDPILGADYLWQVYVAADSEYSGRVTVPVLWDRQKRTIVNNESRDILRMLTTVFRPFGQRPDLDLCPAELRADIDRAIEAIYEPINDGVYRCGFARTQDAHEKAVRELFAALDHWEEVLGRQRFTCGDVLTEADLCLFATLFRFDIVYVTHFKCNIRRIVDYPNLWGFVRDVYQTANVAETCDVERTKLHYFGSHPLVNPRGLVPVGPEIDFGTPHGRGSK